ncbi:hypothetical protein ACJIZ3_002752 [Penstemon smallii]|uniref:Uncharacterized protein n=1 Tax=Penstemon smallii TaxID=265156 RepID=A0ABD3U7A6_9LAMI
MKKMLWSKAPSSACLREVCRNEKEKVVDSLRGKPNVNEEYREAFRTNSYIEMCKKVQCQIETITCFDEEQSFSSSSSSSSIHLPRTQNVHLFQYLLEPRPETLTSIIESSNLHQCLLNYFEVSLEACKICESLLTNVHQVRINYLSIKNVIKSIKLVPDSADRTHNHYNATFRNLASYVKHKNPFSSMNSEKFNELHDSHVSLLHKLTSQCTKTKRRSIKFIKFIKKLMATLLVAGCGTMAIVLLVLAIHSVVGMVGAPALVLCILVVFLVKKIKRAKKISSKTCGQLDIAARGVYILINDFGTMSRIVKRLNEEMEHRRFVADICVKKGNNNHVLREVVNEFQMNESCFLEQLEELENQIYLCFLDINRSRRLVVQEMDKY